MFPIFASSSVPTSREVETDRWHAQAEADYALCRALADRHDAHLKRSLAGLRVGWEKNGPRGLWHSPAGHSAVCRKR